MARVDSWGITGKNAAGFFFNFITVEAEYICNSYASKMCGITVDQLFWEGFILSVPENRCYNDIVSGGFRVQALS